ncbi:serine hydrolase domain-containing protein [Nonomuraea longicatena]|uniref:Serine hydrolase domain-containing protein n=1 Tax=Nonomuraea longicatena TaxID=83682 RepID=A0ABP4B368_9ACTN
MHCDPRFSRVREVFEEHLDKGLDLGAAFAVHVGGELVVDLWGGVADRRTGRPWERETPVFAYSCTKALTAAVALRVIPDPARRVVDFWPEYAAGGKADTTVEHLLTHQAGLPTVEEEVPVEEFGDLPAIAARLAAQTPLWRPGTAHGYHALTYGFLVGEVVRRVTGQSVGELVAESAAPYGLETWVGAPDDVIARAARLTASPPRDDAPAGGLLAGNTPAALAARDPGSLMNRALGNPGMHRLKGGANHPIVLRAGWPGAGVVTTARGLAGFYRELIAGSLLPLDRLRDAVRVRVEGPDRVLMTGSAFGLGFARPSAAFLTPVPAAKAFGHGGLGGSIGLADPSRGLALAYVMNRMAGTDIDSHLRAYRLVEAVYDAF